MKSYRRRLSSIPVLIAGAAVVAGAGGGCSAVNSAASNIAGLASGCDEFNQGQSAITSLSIDDDTKAFVSASATLESFVNTAENDVLNACIAINKDLGVTDTWSAMAPEAGAPPDSETTAACNAAAAKITAVLQANASAGCTLVYSPAHCIVDETKEVDCEKTCTNSTSCTPGNITTLCSPAEITGECSGTCNAGACCEGSFTNVAQCSGSCALDCTGTCDGSPCHGTHCGGVCVGTCTGDCTLSSEAQVSCGAHVNCRGGCSVQYTAPSCETTVTPPACSVSQTCQDSCRCSVESQSTCTPAEAEIECSASANLSAEVTAVVNTIKTNLPALITLVETQGPIALDAANVVKDTGTTLVSNTSTLTGKGLACAGTAVTADATAAASLNVSVNACASVSRACGGPGMGAVPDAGVTITVTSDGGSTTTSSSDGGTPDAGGSTDAGTSSETSTPVEAGATDGAAQD
jgi:hypothetical protein